MSKFAVEVFELNIEQHPDPTVTALGVVHHRAWTLVCRKADFEGSRLAAHVPIDAVVPDTEEWKWVGNGGRVKPARLRGVISQGVLVPGKAYPHWKVGDDVAAELGIRKWEPPAPAEGDQENLAEPAEFHHYTDIQKLQQHPGLLVPGELVRLDEKLHGTNWRAGVVDGVFYVGSHKNAKRPDEKNLYWKAAIRYGVEEKLRGWAERHHPGRSVLLHGEVIGVQDIKYGSNAGAGELRIFDISVNGDYLDSAALDAALAELGLPGVPCLGVLPFDHDAAVAMAEGQSTLADHVREGVVVRPVAERRNDAVGRVILKAIGNGFHNRRGKQKDSH